MPHGIPLPAGLPAQRIPCGTSALIAESSVRSYSSIPPLRGFFSL